MSDPKNKIEAIAASELAISDARAGIDMKRRTAWLFVEEENLKAWALREKVDDTCSFTMEALARLHFKKNETTVVRFGVNFRDRTLYAVWNGEEPKPTFEPDF